VSTHRRRLARVGGWGVKLRCLGCAFIGVGGGMAAWARTIGEGETRGKTGGATA
jgi:hypothetical protein